MPTPISHLVGTVRECLFLKVAIFIFIFKYIYKKKNLTPMSQYFEFAFKTPTPQKHSIEAAAAVGEDEFDELWLLDPDRTSALRSCDGVE